MKIKNIIGFFKDSGIRFEALAARGIYDKLNDEEYILKKYKARIGKNININNPRTFNEKMQWLKLHDRRPVYSNMVDKYEVKKIVANLLGEKYVIPTLGIWESFEEIDFAQLPNQFVLKCTHDSGGVIICKNKKEFDINRAERVINKSLNTNYYFHGREWPYLHVQPRIIAEQYMEEGTLKELRDYKVFVFNGVPHCIQVDYNRFINHKRNFYSTEWKYMPFTTCYPTEENHIIERPECLEELLALAKTLANALENPPFIRTDFYIIKKQIYFGEVTFYHGSGYEKFYPDEYDLKLGELIDLGENV